MSKFKKAKEMYTSPTPAKWRKLGDALLLMSTTLSTYSIGDEWGEEVTMTIMITGVVGKFLTNFFSEDNA